VLDLEMPEMNGIQFLKERQRRGITVPVIILSSLAEKGARITMEALGLGASDFVLKPGGVMSGRDMKDAAAELLQIARIYGTRGRRAAAEAARTGEQPARIEESAADEYKTPPAPRAHKKKVTPLRGHGTIDVVAIGISTGGPNALREMLPNLGADFSVPVLVVQHMPAGFTQEFAESLGRICHLDVKEARDGDLIRKGRIFIAPGDSHMTVEAKTLANVVRLSDAPPVSGHRPSADVLFASVAKTYSNRCLAVIMTGMGKDGAEEIGTIYREGGTTLAQDEASSVVFGMPHAAIEAGVINEVVPLARMAETVNRLCRERP
jgi:two-component system chemotaxis response regulator CheB